MKKQLIIVSLLMGTLSLWGMKPAKINQDEARLGGFAVMNNQNLISLKRFAKFDEYAGVYFKAGTKKEELVYILDWIKHWLPTIVYYTQDELNNPESTMVSFVYNIIDDFVTGKTSNESILVDFQKANDLFSAIYFIYLSEHPDKVCDVLATYFNKSVINNTHYRSFMRTMLKVLEEYVYELLDSQDAEQVIKEQWGQIIGSVDKYLEDFISLPKNEELCERYFKVLQSICSELKKAKQGNYKINIIPQIPLYGSSSKLVLPQNAESIESSDENIIQKKANAALIGSVLMKHQQQQQKQQIANTLTVASLVTNAHVLQNPHVQELPAEAQLEPTAWQNAKDWFWWFNDGIESLWGRTWRYFQGKND